MKITVTGYRFGIDRMPTSIRKNCDDSWVVTTEGPRGPKCTKSAGVLIGLSAWSGRVSTGALENTSAGALRKSTGTLNTSTGALQGE